MHAHTTDKATRPQKNRLKLLESWKNPPEEWMQHRTTAPQLSS
jgi:hypothetical protein